MSNPMTEAARSPADRGQRALPLVAALAAIAAGGALWSAARAAHGGAVSSIERGRELALSICASCHVVAKDQPSAPALDPPAPAFAEIASRPATTATSVQTFIQTTHRDGRSAPLPGLQLSDEQALDVANYIMSLRRS